MNDTKTTPERETLSTLATSSGEIRVVLETFDGRPSVVIRAFFWNRTEGRMVPSNMKVRFPPEGAEKIAEGLRAVGEAMGARRDQTMAPNSSPAEIAEARKLCFPVLRYLMREPWTGTGPTSGDVAAGVGADFGPVWLAIRLLYEDGLVTGVSAAGIQTLRLTAAGIARVGDCGPSPEARAGGNGK